MGGIYYIFFVFDVPNWPLILLYKLTTRKNFHRIGRYFPSIITD